MTKRLSLAILLASVCGALAATPSPNDTVLLPGTGGQITDSALNVWTIAPGVVQGTSYPTVAYENAAIAGLNYNVAELAYVNSIVWVSNLKGQWYWWNGNAWHSGANPLPSPTPTPTPGPGQATATWSPPSGIAGYELLYGTTQGGPYPNVIKVGLVYSYTLTGLVSGTTYYFIAQSYDSSGNLSCPTPEAAFTAP